MAGFKITGSGLTKLKNLQNRLGDLTALKRAIAVNQAEEALDLIKEGFREEQDPYGRRWPHRRRETKRTRGRKVLSGETSRLKNGWMRREIGATGFRISSSVNYASHHQSPRRGAGGKLKRERRMMVPDSRRGMPRAWGRALREVAGDAIRDYLTKGKP